MKIKIIFIVFMVVFFTTSLTQSSIAEDVKLDLNVPEDSEAMPKIDEVYNKEKNDYKPIIEYRNNYSIDTVEDGFSPIDEGLAMVTNLLFSLQIKLVESMIFLFDMTISFDSYKIFDNVLESFISEMYKSFYGVVSGIMLSFLGIFFFVKMIKNEQVEFWAGLFKTVVIIAIATFYFTNPLFIAEKIEKASSQLTEMVLNSSNKVDAPSINKSKKDLAHLL